MSETWYHGKAMNQKSENSQLKQLKNNLLIQRNKFKKKITKSYLKMRKHVLFNF